MKTDKLWVRIGDGGEYEALDGIEEADLEYRLPSGTPKWVVGGFVLPPDYVGQNYISFYWGDESSALTRSLNQEEKALVESILKTERNQAI